MSDKTFYVTTPIYYVNARPHIGHAYTTIVADVLARRHRLLGEDTFFLTGTDEHGQKIERSAAAAGIPPQQFADQVSKSFEDLWRRMGITNNDYIRTTSEKHKRGVQHLFSELYKNGFIYLSTYTGAYCVSDEAFVDAPVGTPCPDCGRLLEQVTEENFFFKLSAFQRPLLDLIESKTLVITPDARRNEVLSFLRGDLQTIVREYWDKKLNDATNEQAAAMGFSKASVMTMGILSKEQMEEAYLAAGPRVAKSPMGVYYIPGALKDLSISRSSFTWGIPVPEPAASTAAQKHVIYVWLDALANYMTALGYGSDDTTLFDKFWPADLHLVGKEIIRFHCVYWPAFLLALNPAFNASSPDPVILSEGRSPQSKDPDNASPTTTANTFSATTPGAPGPASGTWAATNPQGPQLTFDQHKAWAKKWLPKAVTAHGWLLFEDSKMSKSKGNIVRTETILEGFGTLCPPPVSPPPSLGLSSFAVGGGSASPAEPQPSSESTDRRGTASAVPLDPTQSGASAPEVRLATQQDRDLFATDVLRYHLLREIPFGQDGSFSFDAMITRYNADLANGYGNLVSRTLTMIGKYFAGKIPELSSELSYEIEKFHEAIEGSEGRQVRSYLFRQLSSQIDRQDFYTFMQSAAYYVSRTDNVLSTRTPWKDRETPADTDKNRRISIYYAAESIRIITALLYPILPYATAKVWHQLGLGDIEAAARNGELTNLEWGGLKPGTKLGTLSPIFPRADKGLAQIMTDMENPTPADPTPADPAAVRLIPDPAVAVAPAPAAEPTPEAPTITIDDFAKIELRVAEIKLAERIPKADKLLRLEVDLGELGPRQILSGIAEWYTPEDLIGRRIIVITNLAPRKMRGLESHGMLLAASQEGGKPYLATVPEGVPIGTRLK